MYLFTSNTSKNNFFYKFFILFCLLITATMQAHAEKRTLISKDEANWVFGLSLEEWKENAARARDAGVAGYEISETGEHTLIINTEIAMMIVTPVYSKNEDTSPWKASLRFIVHENFEDLWRGLSDSDLKDLVNEIYSEMLPEYTVFTSYIMNDELVVQDIQILKRGYDDVADNMGQKTNGCFDECVVRSAVTEEKNEAPNESFFDSQNKLVVCSQPIPQFTLGIDSKPNRSQVAYLCSCIWSSFPVDGWERRTAEKIRNGDDPGWRMGAFQSRMSESFKKCGAMDF